MTIEKFWLIAKGAIKHLPGMRYFLHKETGGTIGSRYCYTVWLRHLSNWNRINNNVPKVVAELGPGDSLGIGLAALLSGSEKLYALDVVKYWDNNRNLEIFDELVDLFKNETSIPNNKEFPMVKPELDNYHFPSNIISDLVLKKALSEERLNSIRKEILDIDNPNNIFITCQIPWSDEKIINENSVDFIYSQAVLEHVEDMDNTYNAMSKWIKPSGLISHTIDFKSHGVTKKWNGHWVFNNFEWNIVKGGKLFLINRQPLSKHIELHEKYGFNIISKSKVKMENNLNIKHFSKEFRNLSEDDVTTSVAYVLSRKE